MSGKTHPPTPVTWSPDYMSAPGIQEMMAMHNVATVSASRLAALVEAAESLLADESRLRVFDQQRRRVLAGAMRGALSAMKGKETP